MTDIEQLTLSINNSPDDATLYLQRGKLYMRLNSYGNAINDLNRALALDELNLEAAEYLKMIKEILDFRNTDIYNP